MRRYTLYLLSLVNVLLVLSLVALWIDANGMLRNATWVAPEARTAELVAPPGDLAATKRADNLTGFVATLDRPLFSPTRRPPPPKPVAATVAPDPLANIRLSGVFGHAGFGGIIARIDGKSRRVMLDESVGDWRLKSIEAGEATMVRGDETRVLRVERARLAAAPASPATPGEATNGTAPVQNTVLEQQQRQQEEARATLQRRNAFRAKAGLPPVTE